MSIAVETMTDVAQAVRVRVRALGTGPFLDSRAPWPPCADMHRALLALTFAWCLVHRAYALTDRYFTTSDSVRLHYIEAGAPDLPTIVFVPGWTMPLDDLFEI